MAGISSSEHPFQWMSRFVALLLVAASFFGTFGCGGSSSGGPPPPKILPPNIVKAFGASSVGLNGSTTLTFNLSNPNTSQTLSGVGFTDTLPSGQVVAAPNGLTGTCGGGTITAAAGSSSVSLSGATLSASSSCSLFLNVTGVTSSTQNNTTGPVTSNEGGNGGTATATLIVAGPSQQPQEPTDITPISGQAYYVLDQLSGLQIDLNNGSTVTGDHLLQQPRSFTDTSQR